MNEAQAAHEERRYGGVEFDYDAADTDDTDEMPGGINLRDIQIKASKFFFNLINKSRTERAARLRVACARYVITRYEKPNAICARLGVKRRRFFEVCAEIREECGLPPATKRKRKSLKRT